MKKFAILLGFVAFFLAGFVTGILIDKKNHRDKVVNETAVYKEKVLPLEKYSFDNLAKGNIKAGNFTVVDLLDSDEEYSSYLFEFEFSPDLGNETKKTTGMLNIPNGDGKYPLIVMNRGYVDQKIYVTGVGTRNSSYEYAKAGFITVAVDFLGYGGSDEQAGDVLEARFQSYVAVLSLLKSLDQIEQWNKQDLYLWGHSNGGLISLTVLAVTGEDYPTVLWAPVSKPFPYSVLYYTDESDDGGKFLRGEIARFEQDYDASKYSIDKYLDRIKARLQIHQGGADDAVPIDWSNDLAGMLEKNGLEIVYYTYPAADHNMNPDWDTVVARDIEFFNNNNRISYD